MSRMENATAFSTGFARCVLDISISVCYTNRAPKGNLTKLRFSIEDLCMKRNAIFTSALLAAVTLPTAFAEPTNGTITSVEWLNGKCSVVVQGESKPRVSKMAREDCETSKAMVGMHIDMVTAQ